MERPEQIRIVEALILASPEPISAARLGRITPECNAALARDLIRELRETYEKQDRSCEIWDVAGGYQIRTRAEFSGYLQGHFEQGRGGVANHELSGGARNPLSPALASAGV